MKRFLLYLFFILIVIGIWTISHFNVFGEDAFKPESANVLIAGLAFAGVIIGLFQQQAEIQLQRNDLELQREEMKLTREEIHEQNKTFSTQRFENTFFNMLNLHHDIIDKIQIQDISRVKEGRDAFSTLLHFLSERLKRVNISESEKWPLLDTTYTDFYHKYNSELGHYFRNLYRIIKIIDTAVFSENLLEDYKVKYEYTSIVRSQLSDDELLLIYYNCGTRNGIDFFRPYIEKYTLFKNLPKSRIHFLGQIERLYFKSAFEKPVELALFLSFFSETNTREKLFEHEAMIFQTNTIFP